MQKRRRQCQRAPARGVAWASNQGHGPTCFDIVLDIFASHPQIHLRPA